MRSIKSPMKLKPMPRMPGASEPRFPQGKDRASEPLELQRIMENVLVGRQHHLLQGGGTPAQRPLSGSQRDGWWTMWHSTESGTSLALSWTPFCPTITPPPATKPFSPCVLFCWESEWENSGCEDSPSGLGRSPDPAPPFAPP